MKFGVEEPNPAPRAGFKSRGTDEEFVSVIDCREDDCPIATVPKDTVEGLNTTCAVGTVGRDVE